jgi:hypothetical protein
MTVYSNTRPVTLSQLQVDCAYKSCECYGTLKRRVLCRSVEHISVHFTCFQYGAKKQRVLKRYHFYMTVVVLLCYIALCNLIQYCSKLPIPVAVRSKAWVCGRSLAGIGVSNSAEGMDVCLS